MTNCTQKNNHFIISSPSKHATSHTYHRICVKTQSLEGQYGVVGLDHNVTQTPKIRKHRISLNQRLRISSKKYINNQSKNFHHITCLLFFPRGKIQHRTQCHQILSDISRTPQDYRCYRLHDQVYQI